MGFVKRKAMMKAKLSVKDFQKRLSFRHSGGSIDDFY